MLSIIIPVWNQLSITEDCIESIKANTEDYEIIIVDNGSDPPFKDPTIRNAYNLGFPVAVNQGIKKAKGDIICLLNNDVIVTPGWADKLASHLNKYAIVSPLTNYCAGIQKTAIPVYYNEDELYQASTNWAHDRKGMVLPANWVIGFCFMFKKSLYDEIGEFDESMWPSSGEEIDFCYRAKAAGHKTAIVQDVYVHHIGSVTFQDMHNSGLLDYNELCQKTSDLIASKWGKDFWQEQIAFPETGDRIRLNLGCGKFKVKGFINIDEEPTVGPDVICDITHLPYDPGTVDEIYAGHVLEHFTYADGIKALYYWHSLLKENGVISICVPDYDYLVKQYVANPSPKALREFNDVYIYSGNQKSPHLYAYSGALLKQVMGEVGFIDIEQMPVNHPYFPFPVEWQIGFTAKKGSANDN